MWLHEIKHDGFRGIARKDARRCGSTAAPART
jgi:ATP-dependent DNA ligase